MYADPALIRKHVFKLNLSDREAHLVNALCAYSGAQKATLLRELAMEGAEQMLHSLNSESDGDKQQRTN